jgi:hypothetical protein
LSGLKCQYVSSVINCAGEIHTFIFKHRISQEIPKIGDCYKSFLEINFLNILILVSRDSSVGIALGYGLDDRGSRVRFPTGAGNFSLHHHVQNGSGAHPASYPMGTGGSSLGVKRAGSEADHSPPSNAEVIE